MLAAVLHDFDELVLEDVPTPRAVDFGDVVVRIKSCGFCATDYKAIKGIRRNVTFPSIQGHEPSGIVSEVGPGVSRFAVGDEVIVQPLGHCGFCKWCRLGLTHYCENAFVLGGDGPDDVRDGAFAEYMLTKDSTLYPKPASDIVRCRRRHGAAGGRVEGRHRAQRDESRRRRRGDRRGQHRPAVHDGRARQPARPI